MQLADFKNLLLTADSKATKWKGVGTGNYTTWRPFEFPALMADGERSEKIMRIQVDRFTKLDNDPVVTAIAEALAGDDDVAYEYLVDFEPDTGYIHHIFDCTVV